MSPKTLVLDELIEQLQFKNLIVVIGPTKSGKVIISKELSKQLKKPLIITDEIFDKYGPSMGHSLLVSNFTYSYYSNSSIIIEGVHTYRMLRSVYKDKKILPSVIIKINCDEDTISHFYAKDNEKRKLKNALRFNKGLNTIWESYIKLVDKRVLKPRIIELDTSLTKEELGL